jgi:iron complex transport system substrate-binding protein
VRRLTFPVMVVFLGCSPRVPPTAPTRAAPAPQRIVCLTPGLTEMVFALGAGDRVVGVSAYSNFPDAAKGKASVGGPDPLKIGTEVIISLVPDLIVADGGFQQRTVESLRRLGLPVVAVSASSVSDVVSTMKSLSDAVSASDEGRRTLARLDADANALSSGRYAETPKVFYLVNEQPLMTAGAGSFTNEIVERAGGRNIFSDAREQYPTVNEEELIRRNPDVIVLVRPADAEAKRQELRAKPSWQSLTAVKQNRIIFVDEDRGSRPGPRIFDAIRELEAALHPKPNP